MEQFTNHILRPAAYAAERGETGFERHFEGNEDKRYIWSGNSVRKVPEDFEPVCMSMTEDDHEEFLRWIDVNDPIQYYPEFFRTELLHPENGVKHFVTDERVRED